MKRAIIAAVTIAFVSLTVAPAFADDTNLKTQSGIKKFWQEQMDNSRGGDGGGGGG